MILYDNPSRRTETGRLFSKMMVTIILLTTLALIAFGPQSRNYDTFGGRTHSELVPTE
jgi:hypothetical protein